MLPKTFTITQPTRLTFGAGSVDTLAALARSFGGTKAFLVVDPGVKQAGLLDKITTPLKRDKLAFEIYDQLTPEPGLKLADKGCALAKKAKCDCVIGVGGGSAMDVAKAVAILMTNGGKAKDYLGLGKIK